jgi:metal-responsive CopG/Arc/MetJ family transcriptional regulator
MTPPEKMKRRQVLMSDTLWEAVNLIARADGSNASAIIRKATLNLVRKRRGEARRAKARAAEVPAHG